MTQYLPDSDNEEDLPSDAESEFVGWLGEKEDEEEIEGEEGDVVVGSAVELS